MAYEDMNRCPQTEEEMKDYFFTLIGRKVGDNANDWYSVMLKRYDWKGTLMSIPRGVGPNIQQKPDAPFFGLTQQMGSEGNPQARVFLPTDKGDDNGYFTQQVQYIEDTPGGQHGTDFVWSWNHKNETHNPYVPVTGAGTDPGPGPGPGPDPNPPENPDNEARIAALESEVLDLQKRLDVLEGAALRNGERLSISRPDGGGYLNDPGDGTADFVEGDVNSPTTMLRAWRRGEVGE